MESDGCTCFPDGDWLPCCVGHDYAYADGGSLWDKLKADWWLMVCVGKRPGAWHWIIGFIMFIGVVLGGNTHFRWRKG